MYPWSKSSVKVLHDDWGVRKRLVFVLKKIKEELEFYLFIYLFIFFGVVIIHFRRWVNDISNGIDDQLRRWVNDIIIMGSKSN